MNQQIVDIVYKTRAEWKKDLITTMNHGVHRLVWIQCDLMGGMFAREESLLLHAPRAHERRDRNWPLIAVAPREHE